MKKKCICLYSLGYEEVILHYIKDFLSNSPDLKGRVSPDYASQLRKWLYFIKFSCSFCTKAYSKTNRSIFVIHCNPFCCCSTEGSIISVIIE